MPAAQSARLDTDLAAMLHEDVRPGLQDLRRRMGIPRATSAIAAAAVDRSATAAKPSRLSGITSSATAEAARAGAGVNIAAVAETRHRQAAQPVHAAAGAGGLESAKGRPGAADRLVAGETGPLQRRHARRRDEQAAAEPGTTAATRLAARAARRAGVGDRQVPQGQAALIQQEPAMRVLTVDGRAIADDGQRRPRRQIDRTQIAVERQRALGGARLIV